MKKITFILFFCCFFNFLNASTFEDKLLMQEKFSNYDKLINENKNKPLVYKLIAVNSFFNQVKYQDDRSTWNKKDYWAKPDEFLKKGAGDCEDFALAKLYALQQLGISKDKFKLIYSKIKYGKITKPHIVLAYYYNEKKEPLILDNFSTKITSANKRKDLVYIYAFNTIMLDK